MRYALLLTLAAAAHTQAQTCGWTSEFPQGWVDGPVRAMATVDFGTGPRLYLGGDFQHLPPFEAGHVAAWDGMDWHQLGPGTDGSVRALLGVGTGPGARLYAGGDFSAPGAHVARWDGSQRLPTALPRGCGLWDRCERQEACRHQALRT